MTESPQQLFTWLTSWLSQEFRGRQNTELLGFESQGTYKDSLAMVSVVIDCSSIVHEVDIHSTSLSPWPLPSLLYEVPSVTFLYEVPGCEEVYKSWCVVG